MWEESLSKHIRTAVTAFAYNANQIITQQRVEGASLDDIYFANVGAIHGIGIEAEVETRLPNGIAARFSQTFARVEDQITGAPISNSPRHLSKFGVQIPVARLFLSVEGQYVGERLTLGGETLDGFLTPNPHADIAA